MCLICNFLALENAKDPLLEPIDQTDRCSVRIRLRSSSSSSLLLVVAGRVLIPSASATYVEILVLMARPVSGHGDDVSVCAWAGCGAYVCDVAGACTMKFTNKIVSSSPM